MSDRPNGVWEHVVAKVAPGGVLLRSGDLAGGLASDMTVLDIGHDDGSAERVIVRRARRQGDWSLSISDEYRLLVALHVSGLPVPMPRLLDDSGTILPVTYSVLGFVDGTTRFTTDDAERTGRTYATQLAAIHDIDPAVMNGLDLPKRAEGTDRLLAAPPAALDDRLREGLIREVLRAGRNRLRAAPLRLLHGDFWPGNVLWEGDEIVAVIDWQSASLGDPLADVAVSRLDLLWAFGPEAMSAFTAEYLARSHTDPTNLPIWDLVAALRPAGLLSSWASAWADFGRSDVTTSTMRAAHHWFVDRALLQLDRSGRA
jgi:aminoglycoside phosphotransferase (APT) family kinase protein